jgi:hexosaminidase
MLLDQARRDLADEGYELEVGPNLVRMTARTTAGLFYAAETFRQLLPAEAWRRSPAARTTTWAVPSVRILDKPRFAWRGLLLDTARHFIPKTTLLEMLDAMAMHKLNRLQRVHT